MPLLIDTRIRAVAIGENEILRSATVFPVTLPPGNVEHGRYIAERVAMCVECHSGRDAAGNIRSAPIPDVVRRALGEAT